MDINEGWTVKPSLFARNSVNPLNFIKDVWICNEEIPKIDLTTGNPAHLPTEAINAFVHTVLEGRFNGYAPSVGYEEARKAILTYLKLPLQPKDVILSSGASSCLDIAITALADRGQNILVPRPGNPLYKTLATGLGIEVRHYNLRPDSFEMDITNLRNLIDNETSLILINNPHNPTGVSYSVEHLWNILDVAHRHRLPLIVDELYCDLIYPDHNFSPIIGLNAQHNRVPLLVCGGLSRSFMVPGWRLGWILVHDPIEAFGDVRKGLISLSQRIIGCNTVIQGCLGDLLRIPEDFRKDYMLRVRENSHEVVQRLNGRFGLKVKIPQATNYLLVYMDLHHFGQIVDSEQFCRLLYAEMSVFCLPAEVFSSVGFMRLAIDCEKEVLHEAMGRILKFCQKYFNTLNQNAII